MLGKSISNVLQFFILVYTLANKSMLARYYWRYGKWIPKRYWLVVIPVFWKSICWQQQLRRMASNSFVCLFEIIGLSTNTTKSVHSISSCLIAWFNWFKILVHAFNKIISFSICSLLLAPRSSNPPRQYQDYRHRYGETVVVVLLSRTDE